MRKQDKYKNIEQANLMLENKYLKSKGLLKENNDLKWIEDALNEPNVSDVYDDAWDLNIGDKIVFVPTIKGYSYERCVGVIKNSEEIFFPVDYSMDDDFHTEITIGDIKCTPESTEYTNNEITVILEDDWFDEHNVYKID